MIKPLTIKMKLLLLIAACCFVAVQAKSTKTCKLSDWSPFTEWRKPYHDNSVRSYPQPATEGVDVGREAGNHLMAMMESRRLKKERCLADGTCPELAPRNDEGEFTCTDGFINGNLPCLNINQKSFVSLQTLTDDLNYNRDGNDIWGWHDMNTRDEYALMGYYDGVAFVRITDPVNPVVVGRLDTHTSGSSWRDLKVVNDHAFIVSEASGHGVQIFDLSHLRGVNDYTIFEEDAHYGTLSNCHNIISNTDTNFVYAVGCTGGSNGCGGGLHAIDVTNPMQPAFAGCFGGDGYVHDAQCVSYDGPDADYPGKEICYCYNEDTFTIVDVTDKNNMQMLSRTGYNNAQYTHQGWATEDLALVLLDDELDEQYGDGIQKTYLWDVSDLDAPTLVSTYNSGLNSIDHNQYIIGDLTYQANYMTGLRILRIDQATPSLTEVAYFDVFPSQDDDQFNGAWSVYPYFISGNMVISSIDYGLYVVRPDSAAMQSVTEPVVERTRYRQILEGDLNSCPHLFETERQ